jgi:hypothetical protein
LQAQQLEILAAIAGIEVGSGGGPRKLEVS